MRANKWKAFMIASGLLAATAIFGSNLTTQASEQVAEVSIEGEQVEAYGTETGSCGENATYVVEGDTLIISGTGAVDKKISLSYPLDEEDITKVIIQEGITEINGAKKYYSSYMSECVFDYFYNLTSIELPSTLTTIGEYAFYECNRLENITIPSGVTIIGKYAFYGCKNMKNIVIPARVTTIGEYTFYNCESLESISISSGVTTIGERAFSNCTALTSITLPLGVTTIGKRAFSSCTALTSITLPSGVTTIGENAFYYCKSLKSITLPSGLTTINEGTFSSCQSLSNVVLPDTIQEIQTDAFEECDALKSIVLNPNIKQIAYAAFDSWYEPLIYCYEGSYAHTYAKNNYIDYELLKGFDGKATVTLASNKFVYDGKAKTPQVTVKKEGKVLVEGIDYSVTYKNNINAGEASVKIIGLGKNYGSLTEYFTIQPKTIKNVSIGLKSLAEKKLSPKVGQVNWSTSNEEVVSISNKKGESCRITAKNTGTAKVTFTTKNIQGVYNVKVKKNTKKVNITLKSNETKKIESKYGEGTWKSSNQKVASVSKGKGKNCTITAKNAGKAKITYQKYGLQVIYNIKVKAVNKEINKNMVSGDKTTLNPKYGEGSWTSSNSSVASISNKDGKSCTITAKNAGTTKITFKKYGVKLIYTIQVKEYLKQENVEVQTCSTKLIYPDYREGSNGSWSTSDANIAKIVEIDGRYCTIQGILPGVAEVTYTVGGRRTVFKVTVKGLTTPPIAGASIDVNFVGGVEPYIRIANTTNKTMKYIRFRATFYNAVNDQVYSDIGEYSAINYTITGPIAPWESKGYTMETGFWNSTTAKMYIGTMEVEYMDGTKQNMTINQFYTE